MNKKAEDQYNYDLNDGFRLYLACYISVYEALPCGKMGGIQNKSQDGDQTVGDGFESGLYPLQTLKGFRRSGSKRRNGVRTGKSIKRLTMVLRKDLWIW